MPGNATNLKALLGCLQEQRCHVIPEKMQKSLPCIQLRIREPGKRREGVRLVASAYGPLEEWGDTQRCERVRVDEKIFGFTEDGLLRAIAWSKEVVHKLRNEGTCPDCCSTEPTRTEPPRKRLKVNGCPKCWRCLLDAAVGF